MWSCGLCSGLWEGREPRKAVGMGPQTLQGSSSEAMCEQTSESEPMDESSQHQALDPPASPKNTQLGKAGAGRVTSAADSQELTNTGLADTNKPRFEKLHVPECRSNE